MIASGELTKKYISPLCKHNSVWEPRAHFFPGMTGRAVKTWLAENLDLKSASSRSALLTAFSHLHYVNFQGERVSSRHSFVACYGLLQNEPLHLILADFSWWHSPFCMLWTATLMPGVSMTILVIFPSLIDCHQSREKVPISTLDYEVKERCL